MSTEWSSDIENVLDNIRLNSVLMGEEHKRRYISLKGILQYFRLPVIIIAGLNSVISVGFQPYLPQGIISAITCLLSLTCGIIGSIELYLAIQNQMENELLVSKEFYLLSTSIFKMLSLNIEHRKMDGIDFLEECYNTYTELISKSNVIANKIKDKLIPVHHMLSESDQSSVNTSNTQNQINIEPFYNISIPTEEMANEINMIVEKDNNKDIENNLRSDSSDESKSLSSQETLEQSILNNLQRLI